MNDSTKVLRKKIITYYWLIISLLIYVVYYKFFIDAPGLFISENDGPLFVQIGENIANGKWLGTYDWHTLIKNPFTPLMISLFKIFKVKYNAGIFSAYFLSGPGSNPHSF